MAESNGAWGAFGEDTNEFKEAWDSYDSLSEAGDNATLDAFCKRKRITIPALIRSQAKLATPEVLAFAYERGVKFRNMIDGSMWSIPGSEWTTCRRIPAGPGQTEQAIVCEGETDGARLSLVYPETDVLVMPGGARNWTPQMTEQIATYGEVYAALDNDEAGNEGSQKIAAAHVNVKRLLAPGDGDWCDTDDIVDLSSEQNTPDVDVPLTDLLLVKAGDMLDMEVPEQASWFEHALLPIGGQLIVHGWAKGYKSYSAFDLLAQAAQGEEWCGFENMEEPCKVAIMQFEISWPYYHQRIRQLLSSAREPELFKENFLTWTPMQRPRLMAGDLKQEDVILNALTKNGVQIVLVDPIRRATGMADLNAENEVRKMLHFFERIQDLGITVVATHHDNKDGARSRGGSTIAMTGSGAFAGDADTIVSVEIPKGLDEHALQRNLNFTLRNAPAIGPRSMTMQDDGALLYSTEPYFSGQLELPLDEQGPAI